MTKMDTRFESDSKEPHRTQKILPKETSEILFSKFIQKENTNLKYLNIEYQLLSFNLKGNTPSIHMNRVHMKVFI